MFPMHLANFKSYNLYTFQPWWWLYLLYNYQMASSQKDPQKPYMEALRNADIWMKHNHCLHSRNNFTRLFQVRKEGTFLIPTKTVMGVWVSVSLSQYQKQPFCLCVEQVLALVLLIAGEMFVKTEGRRKSEGLGQTFFSISTSAGL